MKKEELIEGEIYRVTEDAKYAYIAKYDDKRHYIGSPTIKGSCSHAVEGKSIGFSFNNDKVYHPSTSQEKEWLEACIAANKFIPLEEVKAKDSVPEYVECTYDYYNGFTKGKIYRTLGICNDGFYKIEKDDKGSTSNGFHVKNGIRSTKEAYDAQQAPKGEDLLTKAKRLYPIGTHIRSAYDSGNKGVVKKEDHYITGAANDRICVTIESDLVMYLLYDGKWAEIIPSEETVTVDNLVKGEVYWCECISGNKYIFEFDDSNENIYSSVKLRVNDSDINKGRHCMAFKGNVKSIRKATPEERALLNPKTVESKPMEESNLNKAKRLYGKGVKVKSLVSHGTWTSAGENFSEDKSNGRVYIQVRTLEGGYRNVYMQEHGWAEIITEAVKEEEEWRIGGWVRFVKDYGFFKQGEIGQISLNYTTFVKVCKDSNFSLPSKGRDIEWIGMNHPGGIPSSMMMDEMGTFKSSRLNTDPIDIYPGAGSKKNVDALPHQKVHFLTKKKSKKSILI